MSWCRELSPGGVRRREERLMCEYRPSHMKQLYDVCNSPVKVWKELPNGTHNDTCAEENYFDYIDEFIEGAMPNGKLTVCRDVAATTGLDIK